MAGSKDRARDGVRHTRRGLLAGAAGALGALAAQMIAAAQPAAASPGQPVLQSADNTGNTRRTAVFTTGKKEWAQLAVPGSGGLGSAGVYAHGQDLGVYADVGGNGPGVHGTGGGGGPGVLGHGGAGGGRGVVGFGVGGSAGVAGIGGPSSSGGGAGGAGVAGFAGSGQGTGVLAYGSGTGPGVQAYGGGSNGAGVLGFGGTGSNGNGVGGYGSGTGAGVAGYGGGTDGGTGPGVLAQAVNGNALQVSGIAAFSRSGLLTIAAGSLSGTVTGVGLSAASLVLATMQQDRPGVWVRSAVPNVAGNSFTISLSKAVTVATDVAWFVVN